MKRDSNRYSRRDLLRNALLGGSAVSLAGCGSTTPPAPAPRAPAPAAPTGAGTPAAGAKRWKIAGVGFQDDQFFKLAGMGMKDAANKAGADFFYSGSQGKVDYEASLIDTYVSRKFDALVIAPVNKTASIPALKKAHDAGIKIITYDATVNADFPAANIRSDQISLGKLTGEVAHRYIQEKLGGKAKVAVITYLGLIPEMATQRNKGFMDQISSLPGVAIVTHQDAWLAEKAVTVVDDVLTRYPDLNLIWGANEGGTVGAVTAVRNAGKSGKVAVFGTDISEQMAGFLLDPDNVLQAVTGQKPYEIGTQALETAVQLLNGKKIEKQVLLPGQLFDRARPDEITTYRDHLRGLTQA